MSSSVKMQFIIPGVCGGFVSPQEFIYMLVIQAHSGGFPALFGLIFIHILMLRMKSVNGMHENYLSYSS